MDCPSCAIKIENAISRIPGVTGVQVSVAGGRVAIKHNVRSSRRYMVEAATSTHPTALQRYREAGTGQLMSPSSHLR